MGLAHLLKVAMSIVKSTCVPLLGNLCVGNLLDGVVGILTVTPGWIPVLILRPQIVKLLFSVELRHSERIPCTSPPPKGSNVELLSLDLEV